MEWNFMKVVFSMLSSYSSYNIHLILQSFVDLIYISVLYPVLP